MESIAEYIIGLSAPIVPEPAAVEANVAADLDLLRAEDVAEIIGVHASTVYRWLQAGNLRGFRIGRVVRIRRVDLAAFVQANLSAQI